MVVVVVTHCGSCGGYTLGYLWWLHTVVFVVVTQCGSCGGYTVW